MNIKPCNTTVNLKIYLAHPPRYRKLEHNIIDDYILLCNDCFDECSKKQLKEPSEIQEAVADLIKIRANNKCECKEDGLFHSII